MHLYVELWNPRPSWLDLSKDERMDYLSQVGPGIQELQDAGIELLGFARADEDVPHRADYRYLAVWGMPEGEDQTRLLEETLEEAGWHEYFDQINARGETVDPQMVLQDMAQVNEVPESSRA